MFKHRKRYNPHSILLYFLVVGSVLVIIIVYMIKMIVSMQFLLYLEPFEIMGIELSVIKYVRTKSISKLSLFT